MEIQQMKSSLLQSAKTLSPPSGEVTSVFVAKSEGFAAKGNSLISARPDIDKLIGTNNLQMACDNNRNFARFMISMFEQYQPEVLVETVLWVFRAYRSHGFQTTYWAANINIWVEMLREELDTDAFAAIYPFYNWLIVNIPVFTSLTDDLSMNEQHSAVGHH